MEIIFNLMFMIIPVIVIVVFILTFITIFRAQVKNTMFKKNVYTIKKFYDKSEGYETNIDDQINDSGAIYCKKCGGRIDSDSAYCKHCGSEVE